jgi:ElaA protein
MTYTSLTFNQLSLDQFYAIMVLRQEVFVVEQDCPYLDCDGKDQVAIHVMGIDDQGRLATYSRVLAQGVSYQDYASISRVINAQHARGKGEGYELMEAAKDTLFAHFGEQAIKISAQAHLQKFYGKLGYVGVGEGYLEDGIPHLAMVRD